MDEECEPEPRVLVRGLLGFVRDLAEGDENARDELIHHKIDPEALPKMQDISNNPEDNRNEKKKNNKKSNSKEEEK